MSSYDKEYYAKNKELKKAKWNAWARTLRGQFITSKNKAKKNGLEWTITFEEYSKLRNDTCFYCWGPLPESSRGLDRINNKLGYTRDNVVPCCKNCNSLKSDILTLEETTEVVKLLKKLREKENIWT